MRRSRRILDRGLAILACVCVLAAGGGAAAESGEDTGGDEGWTGGISLGASLTTGETDSFAGNAQAKTQRELDGDRFRFGLEAFYGKSDGEVDANAQKATGSHRRWLGAEGSRTWYWDTGAEIGRDTIQDINWRALANTGPGRRLWQAGEKRYFDLEAGLGYRHEEYRGDTDTRDDVNARVASEYSEKLGSLEILHTLELLEPMNDPKGFLGRTDLKLSLPIIGSWKFSLRVNLEYQNDPADDAEKVNTKSSVGLEYAF
jgi:putative salt-induced outer membrane protein